MKFNQKKWTSGIILTLAGAVTISTVVLAAGGAPMGGGGPGGSTGNMGQVEMSESIITVKLQTPETGDLSRNTEFIGKVEPAESVSVYPETSGKVTAVHFEAGQTVQKGDLLFELDDTDAQLAYKLAQSNYDQKVISADTTLGSSYDSKLLSAKSKLDSAQQSLNTARLKLKDYNDDSEDSLIAAEKSRDRAYEKMQTAEAAYKADPTDANKKIYDDAETDYLMYRSQVTELENDDDTSLRDLRSSYKNAQTSYDSALADYNLLAGGSLEDTQKSTEAELNSASISLEQSASSLDKYKVYSPISGVIETKAVDVYGMTSAQTAACTISNKNTMSVKFNATADAAVALSMGDAVTLTKGGVDYTALITSINSRADESTGLFPIEAQIQDAGDALLTGVTVKVSAATQKAENALLVPIDLVYYDDGQPYVFTYSDGKAHRTDIAAGMSNSKSIVAESGLTSDSQIITTWHPDLKDGASVVLSDSEASSSSVAAPETASAASDAASRRANG